VICSTPRRGFTLVETLVTLFILSVTVVFVVLVIGVMKNIRDASYESRAFHIAEDQLESLRAAGYGSLPTDGTAFTSPDLVDLPQGSASTSVAVWNAKMKKVGAGVGWLDSAGRARVVSLTTLIVDTGGL